MSGRCKPPSDREPPAGGTNESIDDLHLRLQAGTRALGGETQEALAAAWNMLLKDVLEPTSDFWDPTFEAQVAAETGMHPRTMHASLRASLRGFELDVRELDRPDEGPTLTTPAAAVMAGNVPVLAPQFLRSALLARRGALIKPPSDAPSFTEHFVATLQDRLPLDQTAFVAHRWLGGSAIDVELAQQFDRVAVYGGEDATTRFAELARAEGQMALFGPKYSIGVLSDRSTFALEELALDVALFEQRGCLSVKVVYLLEPDGQPSGFATRLAEALDAITESLPPAQELAEVSAARQWIDLARLTGREAFGTPGQSAVVLDAPHAPLPPGGRSVSLRLVSEAELVERLQAEGHRIQGVSCTGLPSHPEEVRQLANQHSWHLENAGRLQTTGPDWRNGGVDLAAWLEQADHS